MEEIRERYINPLTDFGFKRLFGSEFNKELLISFLNTLLDGEQEIVDISYLENERAGHVSLTCNNSVGDWFSVSLSNDFVGYTVVCDNTKAKYAEIVKFFKTEAELETMFDKWMFVLRNLSRLMDRPAALQDRIFTHLFEQAEIAKFNKVELAQYEDSVKSYRDIINAIKTAEEVKFSEGKAEGRAEGKAEEKLDIAKAMLAEGLPVSTIAKVTGLTPEQISTLK